MPSRPKDQWIPVSDALPQPIRDGKTVSETCLIVDADGDPSIGFYSTVSGWHEYGGELGGRKIDDSAVTHWMPIPEVPRA